MREGGGMRPAIRAVSKSNVPAREMISVSLSLGLFQEKVARQTWCGP